MSDKSIAGFLSYAASSTVNNGDTFRPVCPNCGQWQHPHGDHLDCLNECVRRGFAPGGDPAFPDCPACGGAGALLGCLGDLIHYRCRNCGADYSETQDPHEEAEAEERYLADRGWQDEGSQREEDSE